MELITEDAILQWHEDLDDDVEWLKVALKKLIEWLEASSDEESSDDD